MESIWTRTAEPPRFEPFSGDVRTDVLVIGGGITGILCAHMLTAAGIDCILAEAGRICGGITKNTTAKITSQHNLIYSKLIKEQGIEKARLYLRANQEALGEYKRLCARIDCNFAERDAYVYSRTDPKKIVAELKALELIGESGISAEFASGLPLPFKVAGAVKFGHQAEFHPLKFAYALAGGLKIYENTRILRLTPDGALAENGRIIADNTIIATHFPLPRWDGAYFLKMYQHRSYVLALKNAQQVNGMYIDEAKDGLSFRDYNDLLLIGGGSHRTEKQGGGWKELSDFAAAHYPGASEVCRWATQDCMTLDGMPYIGLLSRRSKHIYTACGYNKWGMTSAMAAAMLLRDLICGRENPYAGLFSPSRSIWRPQLALNAASALAGLLTPTVPRCGHMGCALKYNSQEHSWDCSCHGSRYDSDGRLIDDPAQSDKNGFPGEDS